MTLNFTIIEVGPVEADSPSVQIPSTRMEALRRSAAARRAAASRQRRREAFGIEPHCSRCGGDRDRSGQAYCKACHAFVERWRSILRRGVSRETIPAIGFVLGQLSLAG